jgi:hypothetical protein
MWLVLFIQLLFATILERLIFAITPSWLSVLGTLIILSSALWVAVSCSLYRDATPGRIISSRRCQTAIEKGKQTSRRGIRVVDRSPHGKLRADTDVLER